MCTKTVSSFSSTLFGEYDTERSDQAKRYTAHDTLLGLDQKRFLPFDTSKTTTTIITIVIIKKEEEEDEDEEETR